MKSITQADAFPLRWPDGWPRTRARKSGDQFKTRSSVPSMPGGGYYPMVPISYSRARGQLIEELQRLGAKSLVVSSNVPVKVDGEPVSRAGDRVYDDPGVAIYFMLKGRQMVMAQDAFDSVSANVRSLGLAVEAMRSLERHGGGTMMQKAFDGFAALPAPDGVKPKRPWWTVLNYSENPEDRLDLSVEEVQARFKTLARRRHPDTDGGSAELMAELNEARDEAVRELGG